VKAAVEGRLPRGINIGRLRHPDPERRAGLAPTVLSSATVPMGLSPRRIQTTSSAQWKRHSIPTKLNLTPQNCPVPWGHFYLGTRHA
jgi:hypothetical protein